MRNTPSSLIRNGMPAFAEPTARIFSPAAGEKMERAKRLELIRLLVELVGYHAGCLEAEDRDAQRDSHGLQLANLDAHVGPPLAARRLDQPSVDPGPLPGHEKKGPDAS